MSWFDHFGGEAARTHQLETTLRSLSLSGMLDTPEARIAQAAAGITRRIKAAHFEQFCAIEEWASTGLTDIHHQGHSPGKDGRIQPVSARTSASFSTGVMNPSALRGRRFRLSAMSASPSALWIERSVPFGMY